MELSLQQTTALDYLEDNTTTEVLYGGGAGGGKSILGCYWGTKVSMKYPGSRGLFGRATLKTLRETTLVSFFKVAKMQNLVRGFDFIYKAPSTIVFKNGSEILLKDLGYYPSDPDFDELGSLELTWSFVDEANQIVKKAKNIVRSRIRHGLDEHGLIPKSLWACNPARNWPKTEFYTPAIKGTLPKNKKFVKALVTDNPYISRHYIDNLSELDTASIARLRDGDWEYSDDPTMLMTSEAIANIFTNRFILPIGRKCITADVARFGKDKTVIRVWHGWVVVKRVVMIKKSTVEVANRISLLASEYGISKPNILCDEDGVGGGVVDQLKCSGFIANARPFEGPPGFTGDNYNMLKSQCAFYTAWMVNNNKVYEKCDETTQEVITQELEQIKKKTFDTDKKNAIIPKDEVKATLGRSPDEADTYIMRAWFDVRLVGGINVTGKEQTRPGLDDRNFE